jgi:putative FmdB family regulatory protein
MPLTTTTPEIGAPPALLQTDMPLFEYQCINCKERVEVIQRASDSPYPQCPKCDGEMKKLISSPAIQFKGSGFYKTDYASSKPSESKGDSKSDSKAESKSDSKSESTGESKSETKSDSKSESKSESKGESASAPKAESKSESKSD